MSGAFAQTTAGTLSRRVAPGGVSDQLAVTGLARPAGTAQAMFQPGTYSRSTYALLAATDGVTGTFGTDVCPNNGTMQGPEVSHSSLVTAERDKRGWYHSEATMAAKHMVPPVGLEPTLP